VRKSESLSSFFFLNFVLVEVAFFLHFRVSIFKFFLSPFSLLFSSKTTNTLLRLFETRTRIDTHNNDDDESAFAGKPSARQHERDPSRRVGV
jgi:hypothetical protein